MKKALYSLLIFLCLDVAVFAQAVTVTASAIKVETVSGTCRAGQIRLYVDGTLKVCASGTWSSAGGGGTTINSTNGQVPYRVNSTTFGDSAFASNALNSTYLSATSGASGAGVTLAVAGGGTNESLTLTPKGTGNVLFPAGSTASPSISFAGDANTGFYNSSADRIQAVLGGAHHTLFWSSGLSVQSGQITVGSSINVGLVDAGTNILRVTNASTGAGQLLIGTSTDTANAQLSVYSQSTTRPSLKLNMPSGTSATQEAFGLYNNGTLTAKIDTDGKLSLPLGSAAAPTIHPSTSLTSGLFWVAATDLSVAVSGAERFRFGSGGRFSAADGISIGPSAAAPDAYLLRDAANTVAQVNGTNAQTMRIYGTYTDASNYVRAALAATSTAVTLAAETAGTGADDIPLTITPGGAGLLNLAGGLVMSGTPQTLTGAGAVNLTTYSTLLVTTAADALTLAAGAEGQYKFIRMKTDGGDGTLTVTNLQGGTTITFNDAGDFVLLFYQDAKWHVIVNSGCTVA